MARILDIAIQFAWGLGYAHETGFAAWGCQAAKRVDDA
jgi:hypothetical protein